ncbi:MAG: SDR family oxidoreductase [Thermoleophilaceae bacterium]|nr:SDR family oxidoreductase [Thermoleophilaceae bacterium]
MRKLDALPIIEASNYESILSQRSALITGGSSGIGYAIAEALASEGYGVTISGRRADKLAAAAQTLRDKGYDIHEFAVQASEESELAALFESHKERFGRLDVLVNNAGVGIGGLIEGYPTKRLDLQLDVNVRSHIILTSLALPLLKEAGAEHQNAYIINTGSIAGRDGQPWLSIYAATKAAMINWTNGLQKELGDTGIRVTALSPAFVDTPMTEFAQQNGIEAESMIRPEDLANTVLWLLSLSQFARVPEIVFERLGHDL